MKQKIYWLKQFRKSMTRLTVLLFSILLAGALYAQERTITGVVNDQSGAPMPGVNVIVKGTTTGTMTDLNGKYSIKVPDSKTILSFSFLGFTTQEIVVNDLTAIDVNLEEEATALNEVVVVGYGSMQRSNVTGSISTVKGDDIKRVPVANFVEALRGQVPGVRISKSDGTPGSDVDFFIRGKRSLGATEDKTKPEYVNANAPLIVVDGIPFTNGKVSDINPNDIASIDILKDAAASSIYGSSAANGVVLITTRSGETGKTNITVNLSTAYASLTQKPRLFNADEYVQLKKDAGWYATGDSVGSWQVLDPFEYVNDSLGKEIDWQDKLLRTGRINQCGISITGGNEKFHFYINGDIYNETPIVTNTFYNRYSARMNADYTPYKYVTIGARTQFTLTDADETGTLFDPQNQPDFSTYIGSSPLGRIRDSSGALVPTVNSDQFQYNPFYKYAHSKVKRKNSRASIEPYLELRIIDGLTYKVNGFGEFRNERYTQFHDGMYDEQKLNENFYQYNIGQGYSYLLDNIINYSKTLFDKHQVNITGVYGFQKNNSENFIHTVKTVMTNYLGFYDIVNASPSNPAPATFTREIKQKLSGKAYYVARISYGYDNRYNLTLSRRWDYSSQFGPDKKKGIFSSAAAAWNIHNEQFMQNMPIVNVFKYRISWGEVGNDRIPEFMYLFTADPTTYVINGAIVNGWTSGQSGNYNLRWETSKQFNTGFDFALLKNRISGSFDYYSSQNVDVLLNEQVPVVFGDKDAKIMSNAAETKSWGYGFILSGKILDGEVKWDATLNWSTDKNKIVNLGPKKVDEKGKPVDDPANGWYIGQDINVIKDYKFTGIYQATASDSADAKRLHYDKAYYGGGDPKIADIDGNDTINDKDRIFLGSSVTPDWYGGLTNTISYKGLELSVCIETVQGIKKVNKYIPESLNGIRGNAVKVNYWMPENPWDHGNPSNVFPHPRSGLYDYLDAVRLTDASFVAIRNVSISYTLPQSILKYTKVVKGFTVYIRGNNLKYFTKLKQTYSPESDYGKFPITKNWTTGINLTF